MSLDKARPNGRLVLVSLVFILLPILIFYVLVFVELVNLPYIDDYAILAFLAALRPMHGVVPIFSHILAAQFNEYKVMLGAAVFATQYYLLGRVSFAGLCVVGDLSVLLLALALWKMFLPGVTDWPKRIALFVPVSWLVFQLSYAETLNWAAPAIQNLYVIAFSFASFVLLARKGVLSFTGALLCLVLAIAASGNGLIAAFVGFLALLLARRFRHLLAWCATTVVMILAYAYHYNSMTSQSSHKDSVFKVLLHLNPLYSVSFLGASGGMNLGSHLPRTIGSLVVGFALCGFFALMAIRGKLSSNPTVNCAIGFLFLTGLGVAGIRSDLGLLQSLQSRYHIYSDLLLVFVWFILSERYLQKSTGPLRANRLYLAGCVATILFATVKDIQGYRLMDRRKVELISEMHIYEHPSSADPEAGPWLKSTVDAPPLLLKMNTHARDLLVEAKTLGIYTPPAY